MKHLLWISFLAASASLLAVDTSYSPPLGGMTVTVQAGTASSVGLPLIHASVGTGAMIGRIDSVGPSYIDVHTADWTPGGLSAAATPYYLRIRSGASSGRVFMVTTDGSNTASRVFVDNDGTDLTTLGITTGASGDAYELVLADTLISLFGSSTFIGGSSVTSADIVQTWNGAAWQTYYYNTTNSRWQRSGSGAGFNNFVLRPDRGFMITRRIASGDLTLRVTGRVPETAPRYFHSRAGFTFLSNGLPVDMTYANFALQTRALDWQAGTSPSAALSNADLMQIWNGATWINAYYDSGLSRWRRANVGGANLDNFTISAGQPIMIRRLNTDANANNGLITMPLPYSISL